jgi:cell division protease FtsH
MNEKNKKNSKKNQKFFQWQLEINIKNIFIAFFIFLFLYQLFNSINKEIKQVLPEKPITQVIQEVKDKKVKKIEITDNRLLIEYKDGKYAVSYKEPSESFLKTLKDNNIDPSSLNLVVKDNIGGSVFINFLSNIIPTILMVAFFIFLFRQAKGAQDSVFSFGQARIKKFSKDMPKVTFSDVAGVDEAKKELQEVVDFLKIQKNIKN